MNNRTPPPPGSVGLFLRTDGSLMVARDDSALELHLTPSQLLTLAMDCLQVAVTLDPRCLPEVLHALENTLVQVPVDTPEHAPCLSLN